MITLTLRLKTWACFTVIEHAHMDHEMKKKKDGSLKWMCRKREWERLHEAKVKKGYLTGTLFECVTIAV
jgi:hypothetical protein